MEPPFAVPFAVFRKQAFACERLNQFELRAVFPGERMTKSQLPWFAAKMHVSRHCKRNCPPGPGTDTEIRPELECKDFEAAYHEGYLLE